MGSPGTGALGSRADGGAGARHVRAKPLPLWCWRHGGGRPTRRRANTDHCTRKYTHKIILQYATTIDGKNPYPFWFARDMIGLLKNKKSFFM